MFYLITQNNSYGVFEVNEKLCHRLIIETNSEEEALDKAEELGCYYNGVSKGIDCSCCGDRWYYIAEEINIDKYSTEGYPVYIFDGIYPITEVEWENQYGEYNIIERPRYVTEYGHRKYIGKIQFKNIEEYAKYLADRFGATIPDTRIYYLDGTIKEIYSEKMS